MYLIYFTTNIMHAINKWKRPKLREPTTIDFVLSLLFHALIFAAISVIAGIILMNVLKLNYTASMNWYHDKWLTFVFWYIAPIISLVWFVNNTLLFLKTTRKDYFTKLPSWFHSFYFICLGITAICCISQFFGGCIWYYIFSDNREWSRFGKENFGLDVLLTFYGTTSVLFSYITLRYWRRYIGQTTVSVKTRQQA
jgi:hypothetical protein